MKRLILENSPFSPSQTKKYVKLLIFNTKAFVDSLRSSSSAKFENEKTFLPHNEDLFVDINYFFFNVPQLLEKFNIRDSLKSHFMALWNEIMNQIENGNINSNRLEEIRHSFLIGNYQREFVYSFEDFENEFGHELENDDEKNHQQILKRINYSIVKLINAVFAAEKLISWLSDLRVRRLTGTLDLDLAFKRSINLSVQGGFFIRTPFTIQSLAKYLALIDKPENRSLFKPEDFLLFSKENGIKVYWLKNHELTRKLCVGSSWCIYTNTTGETFQNYVYGSPKRTFYYLEYPMHAVAGRRRAIIHAMEDGSFKVTFLSPNQDMTFSKSQILAIYPALANVFDQLFLYRPDERERSNREIISLVEGNEEYDIPDMARYFIRRNSDDFYSSSVNAILYRGLLNDFENRNNVSDVFSIFVQREDSQITLETLSRLSERTFDAETYIASKNPFNLFDDLALKHQIDENSIFQKKIGLILNSARNETQYFSSKIFSSGKFYIEKIFLDFFDKQIEKNPNSKICAFGDEYMKKLHFSHLIMLAESDIHKYPNFQKRYFSSILDSIFARKLRMINEENFERVINSAYDQYYALSRFFSAEEILEFIEHLTDSGIKSDVLAAFAIAANRYGAIGTSEFWDRYFRKIADSFLAATVKKYVASLNRQLYKMIQLESPWLASSAIDISRMAQYIFLAKRICPKSAEIFSREKLDFFFYLASVLSSGYHPSVDEIEGSLNPKKVISIIGRYSFWFWELIKPQLESGNHYIEFFVKIFIKNFPFFKDIVIINEKFPSLKPLFLDSLRKKIEERPSFYFSAKQIEKINLFLVVLCLLEIGYERLPSAGKMFFASLLKDLRKIEELRNHSSFKSVFSRMKGELLKAIDDFPELESAYNSFLLLNYCDKIVFKFKDGENFINTEKFHAENDSKLRIDFKFFEVQNFSVKNCQIESFRRFPRRCKKAYFENCVFEPGLVCENFVFVESVYLKNCENFIETFLDEEKFNVSGIFAAELSSFKIPKRNFDVRFLNLTDCVLKDSTFDDVAEIFWHSGKFKNVKFFSKVVDLKNKNFDELEFLNLEATIYKNFQTERLTIDATNLKEPLELRNLTVLNNFKLLVTSLENIKMIDIELPRNIFGISVYDQSQDIVVSVDSVKKLIKNEN